MKFIYTFFVLSFQIVLKFVLCTSLELAQLTLKNSNSVDSFVETFDDTEYFLPNTSIPHHYDIGLNLYIGPEDFNYMGFVGINITVYKSTNNLVLHSDGLRVFGHLSSVQNGSNIIPITSLIQNLQNHFLQLNLENEISPGDYRILLTFEARYYDDAGLLLKSYYKLNGEEKFLIASQFETVFARRMFPCYDEPNLKATFRFVVFHPKNYHAISNTEIVKIEKSPLEDKIQTVFDLTPKMSTYLLALGVSDLIKITTNYRDIKVNFFIQPDQIEFSQFALNLTRDSLEFFENYFQINYTLNKLDSMLVPDFHGGMENWGLIIYDIKKVLLDHKLIVSNDLKKMEVSELICHEVGHQWFGNLVTLDWWDYAWLNEGFAMYYMNICADKLIGNNDTLRFMYNSVISTQQMLVADSNGDLNAKSLNEHVEDPTRTMSKFDIHSYIKGSAIVRFMVTYFPNFHNGIKNYLNNHLFGNVKPIDLLNAIENSTNFTNNDLSVKKIMKNWINNPGYPLVTFKIFKKKHISTVLVSQEHFRIGKNLTESNQKWWIPLTIVSEKYLNFDNVEPFKWMSDNDDYVVLKINGIDEGWFIANIQVGVFCRVNYDLENWERLTKYLKGPNYHKIHVLNRAQLINDANYLAKARRLPEHYVLDLLLYLKQEKDQLVHKAAKSAIIKYGRLLRDQIVFPKYQSFVEEIYGKVRAAELLHPPNIKELTENAIITFTANKQTSDFEAFEEVAEHLFNDDDVNEVRAATEIGRSTISQKYQTDFLKKIQNRAEMNKLIREDFLTNNNLMDVNQWLNERY